ncbi:MAG: hypothetical protein OXI66_10685 [Boseongicola sp.]|nr:hypothetical protein [Boseongicola sp.]
MHDSQTRFEGNHVPARTPVSDVVSPDFGAHDRHAQAETARSDFRGEEFEVVS